MIRGNWWCLKKCIRGKAKIATRPTNFIPPATPTTEKKPWNNDTGVHRMRWVEQDAHLGDSLVPSWKKENGRSWPLQVLGPPFEREEVKTNRKALCDSRSIVKKKPIYHPSPERSWSATHLQSQIYKGKHETFGQKELLATSVGRYPLNSP